MDALISSVSFVDLGATAIVTLIVLLVLSGRLVPRTALMDAIRRADVCEERSAIKDETILEQSKQITLLTREYGATTARALAALPVPTEEASDG